VVRGGFTLMEMLVVVAILVVLAGTGGVIYMKYLEDAKKDTARSQTKILAQTVTAYQVKYGDYPPNLAVLAQPTPDGGRPFLEASALIDPWGREYQYAAPGPHHVATLALWPSRIARGLKQADGESLCGKHARLIPCSNCSSCWRC
jgi:type II secretion system protein G